MDETPTPEPGPPLHPSTSPVPETAQTPVPEAIGDWASPLPPPPATTGIPIGSGSIPLRPMGVGEILDVAIRIYRSNWKTLMAIVAVITVPFTLLQNFLTNQIGHPYLLNGHLLVSSVDYGTYRLTLYVFLALSFLVVTPLLRGAMARAVGEIYLGEHPTAGSCLRAARSKFGSLLVAILLSSLIIVGGFILLVIPGIIFYVRYSFVSTTVVVEGQSGTGALSRSWSLAKGNGWRIFGTLFVAGLIVGVVSVILVIPLTLLTLQNSGSANWVLRAVSGSLISVLTTPFLVTTAVLLYFDARIRNEAFDLTVMAREVGLTPS